VAGFDFRYGHKEKGNMETLKIEGKRFFEVTEMKKFEIDHEKVSSTKLRNLIAKGRFADTRHILAHILKVKGQLIPRIINTSSLHNRKHS
jgi:riboflavin kinase/FMN adenylyltransferase